VLDATLPALRAPDKWQAMELRTVANHLNCLRFPHPTCVFYLLMSCKWMNYRILGKTGLKVSEIGYGAWGIGKGAWAGASDDESVKALHRSIDLGLNFIDTALAYGDGHSERLAGQLLKARSETIHVATKIPPKNWQWPARPGVPVTETFPAEHVIACTEESLANLGSESIDVQQFHVWSDEWINQGNWLEAVQKLKEQGKVRFFGVSINDFQPENAIKLVETGVVDTVQVIYNIFEQNPEDGLLPACERHRVGVIVRVALDEGGLTGKITPNTTFEEGDFRNDYFRADRKQKSISAFKTLLLTSASLLIRWLNWRCVMS
jgi:aryl-alcohol dehydrogenase-like predicted oxidoreductase